MKVAFIYVLFLEVYFSFESENWDNSVWRINMNKANIYFRIIRG